MTDAPPTSFLARARVAPPTPPPRSNVTVLHTAGSTTPYGMAGLEANIATLGGTTEGSRNHALNTAAFNLGQLVAGGELEEAVAVAALTETARTIGLSESEIGPTIGSGMRDGGVTPRTAPPMPTYPLTDFVPPPAAHGASGAPTATPTGDTMHQQRVANELAQLRARHDARQIHQAELAAATFRPPVYTATLTDELLLPDDPAVYAIGDLLPQGGNALLTAQFKAGKTTLVNDMVRCLADHDRFLGRYAVDPAPGRIAILNYEVGADQYRRWLREVGIVNTDAVTILNLRGFRLPITAPTVEDWVVAYLMERDVGTLILDPFARAATGTDENSNTEVGVWLDTVDVIKSRAGVRDLVLVTHTGRAEQEQGLERARGATRLDDWADVRWLLTKNKDGERFFRATGRDVETDEELLSYDAATRRLHLGGWDRATVAKRSEEDALVDWIGAHPGASQKDVRACGVASDRQIRKHLDVAIATHRVRVEDTDGTKRHYANGYAFTAAGA